MNMNPVSSVELTYRCSVCTYKVKETKFYSTKKGSPSVSYKIMCPKCDRLTAVIQKDESRSQME